MTPYLISVEYTKANTKKEHAVVEMLQDINFKLSFRTPAQIIQRLHRICEGVNKDFKAGHDAKCHNEFFTNADGKLVTYIATKETIAQIMMRPVLGYLTHDRLYRKDSFNAIVVDGEFHTPTYNTGEYCNKCSLFEKCKSDNTCPINDLFGMEFNHTGKGGEE